MKKLSLCCFTTCFLCLISCNDQPANENQTYFAITINADVVTDESDDWIIIHSYDGDFLDAKPFEAGNILTFGGHKPDKISVTILYSYALPSGERFTSLSSYPEEMPNQHWTISNWRDAATGNSQGQFEVTIPVAEIDYPTRMPRLSDRNISWGSGVVDESGQDVVVKKDIYPNAQDLFLTAIDINGNPRYKFFPNASPGKHSLSIEDLQEFDKTSTISFPPSEKLGLIVRGIEEDQPLSHELGYYVNFFYQWNTEPQEPVSVLTTGYVDWLPLYRTTFWAFYPDNALGYISLGSAPDEPIMIIDDFDVSIADKTFESFSILGVSYDRYSASWNSSSTIEDIRHEVSWNILGARNVLPKLNTSFPSELTSQYPELNNMQLEFSRAIFYKSNLSHDDRVDISFRGAKVKPYEERWKELTK